MMIRLLASLMLAGLTPSLAGAKTVKTEPIIVEPAIESEGSQIPNDAVPVMPDAAGEPAPPAASEDMETESEEAQLPPPEVFYDISLLPKPVARMHAQLTEAAELADLDRIQMILESNEMPPTLSLTEIGDPIEFLKESSGDGEGLETMAILADTLAAGYVHVDQGTPHEMYIWPYFARYPFSKLTPVQKVEMYRLITSADFAEMEAYGVWLFYRVGIGKDGTLHYFVAGE